MNKSNTITKTILTSTILSLLSINTVRALHGNYQEAMQIRRFLNATESYLQHVPLDVIGEHTEKQVRSHTLLLVVMDRTYLQIHGLDGAKGPFNLAERLVVTHRIVSRQVVFQ